MANLKVSELTVADALTGDELIPLVQGGVTKKSTPSALAAYLGAGAVAIENEGVEVTAVASRINFVGGTVEVTDGGAGEVTVTITDPGGGGGGGAVAVEDEGVEVTAAASRINFTGANVSVTDAGSGEVNVSIDGATSAIIASYLYQNTTDVTNSTSTFATKGSIYTVAENYRLYRVAGYFTGAAGQMVKLVIAEVGAANPNTILSIIHNGTPFSAATTGERFVDVDAPVLLEAGKTYAFLWVRTDAGVSGILNAAFTSTVTVLDPLRHFTFVGIARFASVNPTVGDATYLSNTTATRFSFFLLDDEAVTILAGSGGGVEEAPSDGTPYVRQDAAWVSLPSGGGGGITDAPSDGKTYVRKDAAWLELPKQIALSTQTANYTLALADAGTYVRMNSASALALTVPPNGTVAFPIGTVIQVRQVGAGQVSVVEGVGVTVNTPETLLLRKAGSSAALLKVAENAWDLTGDLEATI